VIRSNDNLILPKGYICLDNGIDGGPCSSVSSYTPGTLYASSTSISQEDFAENYPSTDTTLVAGDIISLDQDNNGNVKKSGGAYDSRLVGIISSAPGVLLGGNRHDGFEIPVALSGKVPTKVNTANGAITTGDPITSSSQPGISMKATESGQIVGYALEPYNASSTDASILVFVNVGYYPGAALALDANGQVATTSSSKATSSPEFVETRVSWLASLLDVFNERWNLVIGRITTRELTLAEGTDQTGSVIGKGVILAQTNSVTIQNPAIGTNSKIFITMKGRTGVWWIAEQKDAEFSVQTVDPVVADVPFDYLIVQVQENENSGVMGSPQQEQEQGDPQAGDENQPNPSETTGANEQATSSPIASIEPVITEHLPLTETEATTTLNIGTSDNTTSSSNVIDGVISPPVFSATGDAQIVAEDKHSNATTTAGD